MRNQQSNDALKHTDECFLESARFVRQPTPSSAPIERSTRRRAFAFSARGVSRLLMGMA